LLHPTHEMADPLDKYGLGAFASMLDDGIIPKRPSEETPEKPVPAYLVVSGKEKKHTSPDKEHPLWKYGKPKFPHITRKKMEFADELTELACGCSCKDCIGNYRAYWEEKSFSKELTEALKAERDSMKSVVTEVGAMEKEMREKLSEAQVRPSCPACLWPHMHMHEWQPGRHMSCVLHATRPSR